MAAATMGCWFARITKGVMVTASAEPYYLLILHQCLECNVPRLVQFVLRISLVGVGQGFSGAVVCIK